MVIHTSINSSTPITNFKIHSEYLDAGFNYGSKYLLNVSNKYNPLGIIDSGINKLQLLRGKVDKFSQIITMIPVHKDDIDYITNTNNLSKDEDEIGFVSECDSIITTDPNILLCVKPADCTITVGFARSYDKSFNFIIHAGRNGLTLNLIGKTINYLINNYNVGIDSIKIGVSPALSIKNNNLEFWGDDRLKEVWQNYHEVREGIIYLDTYKLLLDQLINSGVSKENIEIFNIDTFEEAKIGNLFSHRYSTKYNTTNGRFLVYSKLKK